MQKTLLIGFLFFSLSSMSQTKVLHLAPAVVNIGGGSAFISPSFMVDWSIGESTIIETFYGENAYSNSIVGTKWNVTSGILQPFDKNHIIFDNTKPTWTKEEIRLYPIPTRDIAYIDFRSYTTGKISMQLLTLDGRLLGIKEFYHTDATSIQSWNLANLTSGVYHLKITLTSGKGNILKQGTFKIEKIN